MKIAFGVEYDGSRFYGWQRQAVEPTVQQVVELALSKVANEEIVVQCAGRTDTGVHAYGQVAHFETNAERDEHSWIFGANSNLPPEVALRWVKSVDDDFHARFSAYERTYQYVILNRPVRSALYDRKVTWISKVLDVESMQEAANLLVGEYDFNAFRSVACQAKTSIRCVKLIELKRFKNMIIMRIKANAFLHHMVRNIMGVLLEIGLGKKDINWTEEVLLSRDRKQGGVTAPASGLYFMYVQYPEKFNISNDENAVLEMPELIFDE